MKERETMVNLSALSKLYTSGNMKFQCLKLEKFNGLRKKKIEFSSIVRIKRQSGKMSLWEKQILFYSDLLRNPEIGGQSQRVASNGEVRVLLSF